MGFFPKDRGENEKIFDLPSPTKQKHLAHPMFCSPPGFGLGFWIETYTTLEES